MQQCHPIEGLGITQLRNLLTNRYKCKHVYNYHHYAELKPTCTDLRRDGFKVKINNGKVFVFCKECYEKIKKETKK
jgi:hypothetical protein